METKIFQMFSLNRGLFSFFVDINLSSYTEDMGKFFAEGEKPEPEFMEKLTDGYKTCYELSRKIPQSFLDMKGPVYKRFGRQKMFFKCINVSFSKFISRKI